MRLALNSHAKVQVEAIGHEQNSVVIIDDFLENPEILVDEASERTTFDPVAKAGNFYPGIRGAISRENTAVLFQGAHKHLVSEYDVNPNLPARVTLNSYSLATLQPQYLNIMQSLPHFDTPDSDQYAILLYLFKDNLGGTSFYQHLETGYESIPHERTQKYIQTLKSSLGKVDIESKGYVNGDTELFRRTHSVAAKYNRAVIYKSQLLHSGTIRNDQSFSANPRKGRLTANLFVKFS